MTKGNSFCMHCVVAAAAAKASAGIQQDYEEALLVMRRRHAGMPGRAAREFATLAVRVALDCSAAIHAAKQLGDALEGLQWSVRVAD